MQKPYKTMKGNKTIMKKFLVQRVIDDEIIPFLMTETELINYINMADCHGEDYEIYDVSKFGEIRYLHCMGWQPGGLIQVIDEDCMLVVSGYGENH